MACFDLSSAFQVPKFVTFKEFFLIFPVHVLCILSLKKKKKNTLIFPKFSRIFQELRLKTQFQETDRSFQAK